MYDIDVYVVGSWQANCYILSAGGSSVMIDPGAEPEVLLSALGGVQSRGYFDHALPFRPHRRG